MSEGGLDIVYGKIIDEIQCAIEYGKDELDKFMNFEYKSFIQGEINKELMGEDSIYLNVILNEYEVSYDLNEENIEEKLNEEFQKGYKNYFLLGSKKYNFIKNIEKIKSNGLKINLVDDLVKIENNKIKFKVASSYKKGKIEKQIESDFYIKIPNKKENYTNYYFKNKEELIICDDKKSKNINELIEVRNWIRRR
ncbi:hypothetical protein [Tepidibacter formicigenes]|jgi:hypothetical protein|nr:hypothetical protein [Tepidibacter formicigenes]